MADYAKRGHNQGSAFAEIEGNASNRFDSALQEEQNRRSRKFRSWKPGPTLERVRSGCL